MAGYAAARSREIPLSLRGFPQERGSGVLRVQVRRELHGRRAQL